MPLAEATPESCGLSPSRLARIPAFLEERYIKTGDLPNYLVAVVRNGKVCYSAHGGLADVARGTPVAEDTIFRIYSMTKPITSVAIMMLVEEGKIAIEDPVFKYIPSWKDLRVYDGGVYPDFRTKRPARPMLVVDLLRHTSGLTYDFQFRTNVDAAYRELGIGSQKHTLEETIALLAKLPLEFSPGEAWNYSVSTDVLGYLVQVVSGMKFEDFLRSRIFEPLGMIDTGFVVPPEKIGRLAGLYGKGRKRKLVPMDDPRKSDRAAMPKFVSGGGGLVSTAADYLRFSKMLLNGGRLDGVRLLSRRTLKLMASNHIPGGRDLATASTSMFSEAGNEGMGFGLGFSVLMDPAAAMSAGGKGQFAWGGAASTAFWIDPEEDLAVVFMTQLMPSSTFPIRRELQTLVSAAVDDDAPAKSKL
ncbi:beta-lactamase/transpeptidase-like protein [Hyaloraphidium curvatum]|nr:beta-lactamase/transpeptidase-like protein [Hyaloraphidium curvatum]